MLPNGPLKGVELGHVPLHENTTAKKLLLERKSHTTVYTDVSCDVAVASHRPSSPPPSASISAIIQAEERELSIQKLENTS